MENVDNNNETDVTPTVANTTPSVVTQQRNSASLILLILVLILVIVSVIVAYRSNRRVRRLIKAHVIKPIKLYCCGTRSRSSERFDHNEHKQHKRKTSLPSRVKKTVEGVELDYTKAAHEELDEDDDELGSEYSSENMNLHRGGGEDNFTDTLASPVSDGDASEEKLSVAEEESFLGKMIQSVSSISLKKSLHKNVVRKSVASPNFVDEFQVWIKENARSVRGLSKCLTEEAVIEIQASLPRRLSLGEWELIYSTANDGFSLQTFFNRATKSKSTILVIRDSEGYIFGAFLSERWQMKPSQFGNGETMVFTVHPKLQIYPWTRGNSYFATAKSEHIAVGGGKNFAIYISSGLREGSSGPCETFSNPKLSGLPSFQIEVLELWSIST